MSKPIEIRKKGAAYQVFVRGVPVVKLGGKLWFDRALAGIPADGTSPPISVGTNPHRFKREEAKSLAHQIGRYMLNLGDFVWTYVRTTNEKADGTVEDVVWKEWKQ